MKVVDDLKAARDRVERGWCQGRMGALDAHQGDVCSLGALAYATGRLRSKNGIHEVVQAVAAHLPLDFSPYDAIVEFNDAKSTTKQDILNLFDKALADLGGLA